MVQGVTGFCTRWDHGGAIRDDFLEVLEQKTYHPNFRDGHNCKIGYANMAYTISHTDALGTLMLTK